MGNRLWTNYAVSTLASGISDVATSLTVQPGDGAKFALPAGQKYGLATLYTVPETSTSPREIVKYTARLGDVLTIARAQEGTAAQTWASGAFVEVRWTAGSANVVRCEDEPLGSATQQIRGLSIRTHPDASLALSQVMLLHADELVMDDGLSVLDWNRLVANLAASGAGGLDTGSEQASTWYEIYAIRRKSDDTRALLFHRARDYFEDETSTAGEDGQHLLRDAAARTKLAQGFKVDTAGPLAFLDLKVAKVGAPTGQYWLTDESDSSGLPTGTILATSDKYDAARLPTTSLLVRLPFRNPHQKVAATQYHAVLQGDFAIHASNHLLWRADTSAGAYANGSKAAFDGTSWTADADDDFIFKAYILRNETTVIMPGNYDQKCLLGYAYNDGSSNMKFFAQRDRRVYTGGGAAWKIGAWPTAPALLDLKAFVPPIPVLARFGYGNTAGAVGVALGPLHVTDVDDAADVPGQVLGAVWGVAGDRPYEIVRGVPVEYQACMAKAASGNGWLLGYEF